MARASRAGNLGWASGRWRGVVTALAAGLLTWGGAGALAAQQGRIVGSVVDTLNRRRLAGAQISVEGLDRTTTSDSSGRFTLDGIPPGQYRVSFRHPVLDTLAMRAATVTVTVPAGGEVRAALGIPSGRSFLRLCPATPGLATRAAVFGMVRNAVTDEHLIGAQVRVSWATIVVDPMLGPRRRVQTRTVQTDSVGRYVACDLPPDAAVTIAVSADGFEAATGEVPLRPEEAVPLQFGLPPNDVSATATLAGKVVDGERKPLAGAEVWVVTGGAGETGVARTDSAGNFTLTGLRPGTGVVAARKIGSTPAKRTVSLAADRVTPIQLTLAFQALTLPELNVEAKKVSRADQAGFSDRKAGGFGKFYDREAIDKFVGFAAGDVLRVMPSVRLQQGSLGTILANQSLRRSVSGSACNLALYVDGMTTPPDAILNFPKEEIDGIEVYDSPDRVPPEYQGPATSCGAVLIWTRR